MRTDLIIHTCISSLCVVSTIAIFIELDILPLSEAMLAQTLPSTSLTPPVPMAPESRGQSAAARKVAKADQ
eukprot:2428587-Lingulodinium_polyedra.AAC.1